IDAIKETSLNHFGNLLDQTGHETAAQRRRAALALWRFGPELHKELDSSQLGELWRLLPADTRVPDHSIWDHLDLTAAFAGAFAADDNGECALLSVSLGPVQEFIAAARTVSDLWAGSHLLSTMAWQAMKVVADELGPEAVLFPRLRGTALVDLWLMDECGLPAELFEGQPWKKHATTDANPLFSASLPNRFLAVVPAQRAQALARQIETTVRGWTHHKARAAFEQVLAAAGRIDASHGAMQIDEQLAGFPEVHWSIAPYNSVIGFKDSQRQIVGDAGALARCLAPFFPEGHGAPGFLGSDAWQLLNKEIEVEGARFYQPNPGVLYPAIHELADRAQAAAKAHRGFKAMPQKGYRCSLTGTAEWLTDDPEEFMLPPGQRTDTLWAGLAQAKPSWAKKGEHLGALATLKRLWPTFFVEEIAQVLDDKPNRFVVSTHTMALAAPLQRLGQQPLNLDDDLQAEIGACERVALPYKLARELQDHPNRDLIARIPAWLDGRDEGDKTKTEAKRARINRLFEVKPETYYALILMDGDHMGQWLSGEPDKAITYLQSFHPSIRNSLRDRFGDNPPLAAYLQSRRALSPNRHLAISGALGDFSATIARAVVEEEHMGRVLYAGGDDLLAMVPVAELPSVMARLRDAYSGSAVAGEDEDQRNHLRLRKGYVQHRGRLYLTMGATATASIGAVIAHHQAPLGGVLRALRAAEQRAKQEGGRNAFSIQTIKRGGGDVTLTMHWHQANDEQAALQPGNLQVLRELSQAMREQGVSRRAAYNVYAWLSDLPEPDSVGGQDAYRAMLEAMLHHQFERQGLENEGQPVHSRRLARLCRAETATADAKLLENFLSTAEFLARESRSLA
ncbi:MAG TPA: type III-B CRISPR-associated protein Cas10/Cmr2, partial [Salinisphaeraceae bacterium]|nr:type III-B CRISPR-associated protein Cas10/Cmr2 [Salinisphaeraceae bacterium]